METVVIEGQTVRREGGRVHLLEARLDSLPAYRTFRGWADHWDDPGTILVAETTVNFDFEVFFAISVDEVYPDWVKPLWRATLHAVAPDAPDPAVLEAALDLAVLDPDQLPVKDRNAAKIEAMIWYGATATLAEFFSKNPRSAVLAAMAESTGAMANLPVYLDDQVNQLGHTGWDFLKGLIPRQEKSKAEIA